MVVSGNGDDQRRHLPSKSAAVDDADGGYAWRLQQRLPDVVCHSEAEIPSGYKTGSDRLADIAEEHKWTAGSHDVGVAICVYSFRNMSLKDCSFDCDFGVKLVWKEGDFKVEPNDDIEPLTDIMNPCSTIDVIQKRAVSHEHGLVNSFTRQQAKLTVLYNMRWYPFDVQALSIRVRVLDPKVKMICLRYAEMKEFCRQPDWFVYQPCQIDTKDSTGKPLFVYTIILRRKWFSPWVNVICMQWSVTTLAFTSFAVPVDDFENRSAVALTLILTTIAFKLFVAGEMPKVAYLSVADIYVLSAYAMQLIIWMVQGLPLLLRSHQWSDLGDAFDFDGDEHEHIDRVSFRVLAGAWLLFNMVGHAVVFLKVRADLRMVADKKILVADKKILD